MGELYRLDFADGKSYIGATTKTAAIRFKQHKCRANSGAGKANGVYGAWRKYGEPKLIVLAKIEDCELATTENRAMKVFCTMAPSGYNFSSGGEGLACGGGWTWYKRKAFLPNVKMTIPNIKKEYSIKSWAEEAMAKLADERPFSP